MLHTNAFHVCVTFRNAEKEWIAERDQKEEPGQEWEKIAKMCDFNPKSAKNSKDTTRLRSILLQLKQSPPAVDGTNWGDVMEDILISVISVLLLREYLPITPLPPTILSSSGHFLSLLQATGTKNMLFQQDTKFKRKKKQPTCYTKYTCRFVSWKITKVELIISPIFNVHLQLKHNIQARKLIWARLIGDADGHYFFFP